MVSALDEGQGSEDAGEAKRVRGVDGGGDQEVGEECRDGGRFEGRSRAQWRCAGE